MIKDDDVINMIAGKPHDEIISMERNKRWRWYKKILPEEKERAMKIVESVRQFKHSKFMMDLRIGEKHPMYGRTGENHPSFGSTPTEETRAKMSAAKMGEKHPMYGKTFIHTEETKTKIGEASKGRVHTEEFKNKQSIRMTGENNPNFNNWASREPYCQNWTEEVREYIRNLCNRTCTICGKSILQYFRIGKMMMRLHVDHIDENKMQGCDDWGWRLTPLCPSCHSKMQKQKIPWHLLLQLLLLNNKKNQINFLFENVKTEKNMRRSGDKMREKRRKTALDQIDKLEKALRNIGFLKENVQMTDGYTWRGSPREIEEGNLDEVRISVVDFLHALYHAVKKREDKDEKGKATENIG